MRRPLWEVLFGGWHDLDHLAPKYRRSWKFYLIRQALKFPFEFIWLIVVTTVTTVFNRETWRGYRASQYIEGKRLPSTCRNLDCTPAWVVGGHGSACIRCGREA